MSAADVERMKLEKKELQKAVEQLGKSRDYFDQQIWEKEMQYAKKYEEVGEMHKSYGIWSLIFFLQIGGCNLSSTLPTSNRS